MNDLTAQALTISLITKQFEDFTAPSRKALMQIAKHHKEIARQASVMVQPMIEFQRQAAKMAKPIIDMYKQITSVVEKFDLTSQILDLQVSDEEVNTVEQLKKPKGLGSVIIAKEDGFEIYGRLVPVKMNTNHAILLRALLHFEDRGIVTYEMIEEFFRQNKKPHKSGPKIRERILNARDTMYRFIDSLPQELANGQNMIEVVDGKGLQFNNVMYC